MEQDAGRQQSLCDERPTSLGPVSQRISIQHSHRPAPPACVARSMTTQLLTSNTQAPPSEYTGRKRTGSASKKSARRSVGRLPTYT